jgi:peptidyl-dipeptidase A
MRTPLLWPLPLCLLAACGGRSGQPATAPPPTRPTAEAEFAALYADYQPKAEAAYRAANQAWWQASNFGQPEQFEALARAAMAQAELHADPATFAALKRLREGGEVADPLARRLLEVVYLAFAEQQIPAALRQRLIEETTALEQAFNTARAVVDGAEVTANQVTEVLLRSNDSAERQRYWEASKAIGPRLADRIVALVEQRNQAARALGHPDYYQMQLTLNEQEPAAIAALFDDIDRATAPAFDQLKAQLDRELAARFGVRVDQLRPWHYGDVFFQEAPTVAGLDLDPTFAALEPEAITARYFADIGLPVAAEILARSDLYGRPGKVEHAFCGDLDRAGDVRILANLQKNEQWTATLLHELGHGVYDAYLDRQLPFSLRQAAHQLVTEGVAELFGALTRDSDWLGRYTAMPAGQRTRMGALVFARWSLVVVQFERALYADPRQDLERLWWDLVSRYQKVTPPDSLAGRADWATKIHIVTVPAYYHNYLMGELFAAQLRQRIGALVGAPAGQPVALTGRPEIGRFLIEQVFAPGRRYPWPQLVERATGQPLSPAAFLAELGE